LQDRVEWASRENAESVTFLYYNTLVFSFLVIQCIFYRIQRRHTASAFDIFQISNNLPRVWLKADTSSFQGLLAFECEDGFVVADTDHEEVASVGGAASILGGDNIGGEREGLGKKVEPDAVSHGF
jgi:hypothetical protein